MEMQKILLASWRGTRYEVGNVLREVKPILVLLGRHNSQNGLQVCERVLKDPEVPEAELVKRAKVGCNDYLLLKPRSLSFIHP